MHDISLLARELGIDSEHRLFFGRDQAKVALPRLLAADSTITGV